MQLLSCFFVFVFFCCALVVQLLLHPVHLFLARFVIIGRVGALSGALITIELIDWSKLQKALLDWTLGAPRDLFLTLSPLAPS